MSNSKNRVYRSSKDILSSQYLKPVLCPHSERRQIKDKISFLPFLVHFIFHWTATRRVHKMFVQMLYLLLCSQRNAKQKKIIKKNKPNLPKRFKKNVFCCRLQWGAANLLPLQPLYVASMKQFQAVPPMHRSSLWCVGWGLWEYVCCLTFIG